MSAPTEDKKAEPGVVVRRYTCEDTISIALLRMPSLKPGMDMSLAVKVASLKTEAIYTRTFSFEDLSGLCPLINALPAVILNILNYIPSLELTREFGVAHLTYKFGVYTAKLPEMYKAAEPTLALDQCELMLNIGGVEPCGVARLHSDLEACREKAAKSEEAWQNTLEAAERENARLQAAVERLTKNSEDLSAQLAVFAMPAMPEPVIANDNRAKRARE